MPRIVSSCFKILLFGLTLISGLTLSEVREAEATVMGSRPIEILGFDSKDRKLYWFVYDNNEADRPESMPELYFLALERPEHVVPVRSWYERKDDEEDKAFLTRFDQRLEALRRRLVPLVPLDPTGFRFEQQITKADEHPRELNARFFVRVRIEGDRLATPIEETLTTHIMPYVSLTRLYALPGEPFGIALFNHTAVPYEGGYQGHDLALLRLRENAPDGPEGRKNPAPKIDEVEKDESNPKFIEVLGFDRKDRKLYWLERSTDSSRGCTLLPQLYFLQLDAPDRIVPVRSWYTSEGHCNEFEGRLKRLQQRLVRLDSVERVGTGISFQQRIDKRDEEPGKGARFNVHVRVAGGELPASVEKTLVVYREPDVRVREVFTIPDETVVVVIFNVDGEKSGTSETQMQLPCCYDRDVLVISR